MEKANELKYCRDCKKEFENGKEYYCKECWNKRDEEFCDPKNWPDVSPQPFHYNPYVTVTKEEFDNPKLSEERLKELNEKKPYEPGMGIAIETLLKGMEDSFFL
jgi:predicted amidophosphoribosyltransferase